MSRTKHLVYIVHPMVDKIIENEPLGQKTTGAVFHWKDIKTWPHDWKTNENSPDDSEIDKFRRLFQSTYSHIVCYHGCRPTNITNYYSQGLTPSDTNKLKEIARNIFLDIDPPLMLKSELELAESAVGERDDGNLFIMLDDRLFFNKCGQYCIYGSERLLCIANKFGTKKLLRAKKLLRSIGTPTVLRANVPVADIPDSEMCDIITTILDFVDDRIDPPPHCHTILLNTGIAPGNIVSHYTPKEIYDSHEENSIYRYGQEPEYLPWAPSIEDGPV